MATKCITRNRPWAVGEIEEDVATAEAARIAHRIGGIVANDDRIRAAIQSALDTLSLSGSHDDEACEGILAAVAEALCS
jgi:hypothetical protein